jgi:hypothetical protein
MTSPSPLLSAIKNNWPLQYLLYVTASKGWVDATPSKPPTGIYINFILQGDTIVPHHLSTLPPSPQPLEGLGKWQPMKEFTSASLSDCH